MSSAISIRPTDSDDVKWALHTASTQLDRGSLADTIQWVKRAAQYAEDAGDAWRATELKNSARELAERMWTSEPDEAEGQHVAPSSAVDISVEDVEADDLLDELLEDSTAPPPHPGHFQSVPPGVVLRQSYPAESAPPQPIPLYPVMEAPLQPRQHPLNSLPGAWQPPPQSPTGFAQASPAFASPAPFQGQPPVASQGYPSPATDQSGFSAVEAPPTQGPYFVSKAPTLQYGSPQDQEGAPPRPPLPVRRSIRPQAPPAVQPEESTKPPPPHRSSSLGLGLPGGPDVFSSAPPAERFTGVQGPRLPFDVARTPIGSAPELLVSEVDLDTAALAGSSLLPPPPTSEPDLTPEEFEMHLGAQSAENDVVSSTPFDVDPSLADLFAPEEVVEDRDSVDRMSDIVLDPSEFEHQTLLDDQEETHVLTRNVAQSLTDAVRQRPFPPHESGEHEVVSPSGLPTAPPPGPNPALVSSQPPPGSRPVSPDMRRATQLSTSAPPMPFEPAPSAPRASQPAPPFFSASASHPTPPGSGPGAVPSSLPPNAQTGSTSVPPLSIAPTAPSAAPPGPPSSRSTPPPLVRRSLRPESGEYAPAPRGPVSAPEGRDISRTPSSSRAPEVASTPPAPASQSPRSVTAGTTVSPRSERATTGAPAASPPSASPGSVLSEPVVDNVNLATTRGFEDLPEEVQLSLANSARIERLDAGEEVSFFGAAVVTSGRVDILPAFSEEAGAVADEGDVIFTHGNLETSIDLRVVAKMDETRVAVWDPETLRRAIAECPWVADELKLIADRYLALCGATLGPLGERLDHSLRATVFQRLDVRVLNEGDVLVEVGKVIPGLLVVGGGRILLHNAKGEPTGELNMGDFVFANGLLVGAKAPETAIAARGGALVLTAPRQIAHELMMSVPPLVEVLAG